MPTTDIAFSSRFQPEEFRMVDKQVQETVEGSGDDQLVPVEKAEVLFFRLAVQLMETQNVLQTAEGIGVTQGLQHHDISKEGV